MTNTVEYIFMCKCPFRAFAHLKNWNICLYCWVVILLYGASQVAVVKKLPANAGDIKDMGSLPESGRFPGVGNSNPLQSSCLENAMERGAWWATVHGVTESDMTERLSSPHFFILGWPKNSFGFFCKILWKNLSELFDQVNVS